MALQSDYAFLGNGELSIAKCDSATGEPLDFELFGNVSALNVSFSKSTAPLKNFRVPGNPTMRLTNTVTEAGISIVGTDFSMSTLRLYFGGTISSKAAGAVANEILPFNFSTGYPTPMTEDMVFMLKETNIDTTAAITLKHADTLANVIGAGGTTVPSTNYTVTADGMLRIKASYLTGIATRAQAAFWGISYSNKGNTQFAAGATASACTERYWIRLNGRNFAECGAGRERQVVDFYKVSIVPEGDWALISEDYANLNFSGQVLQDSTRAATDEQFFRVRRF